jgi:hypothetical protein
VDFIIIFGSPGGVVATVREQVATSRSQIVFSSRDAGASTLGIGIYNTGA